MNVIRVLSQWRFINKIELDKSQWSGMMADLESISDHNLIYDQPQARQVNEYFINPLCAKFFRGNINIYLHFMSLFHIDVTQVLKILPQVRPGPTYSTLSI